MSPHPANLLLVVMGIALVAIGLWLLVTVGRSVFDEGSQTAGLSGENVHPQVGSVSRPTKYVAGIVLLMFGYHAIAWAWPPTSGLIQFPRELWWLAVLVSIALIVGSRLLDRLEASRW